MNYLISLKDHVKVCFTVIILTSKNKIAFNILSDVKMRQIYEINLIQSN